MYTEEDLKEHYYRQDFEIELDREVEGDGGPWRSYVLAVEGNSVVECLADGVLQEVDQDGEVYKDHWLADLNKDGELYKICLELTRKHFEGV